MMRKDIGQFFIGLFGFGMAMSMLFALVVVFNEGSAYSSIVDAEDYCMSEFISAYEFYRYCSN